MVVGAHIEAVVVVDVLPDGDFILSVWGRKPVCFLQSSIATSQLRDVTACALRNSRGAPADISDEITEARYSSSGTILMR